MAYDVLVRIANALDVPREWMGLGYGGEASPPPSAVEEVDEAVKRRVLLAAASIALVGSPVLGEVLHIPAPPPTPTPLPSRLGAADVAAIKSLTTELRTVTRSYGGGAEVVTSVAQRSLPLMSVPASESIKAELGSALADLHTMAGWCCIDSGHDDNARAHFAQAMDLAGEAGDRYELVSALRHAGIQMRNAGAYDGKHSARGLTWADAVPAGVLMQRSLVSACRSRCDRLVCGLIFGCPSWRRCRATS